MPPSELSILKVKGENVDFIDAFISSDGLSTNLGSLSLTLGELILNGLI